MPPEFAESESEETDEDEGLPLAMSFGELLLGFGSSSVYGMGAVLRCPVHRIARASSFSAQHLVC